MLILVLCLLCTVLDGFTRTLDSFLYLSPDLFASGKRQPPRDANQQRQQSVHQPQVAVEQ